MQRIGPAAGAGQSIGLLGGSFDPPHRGHVHVTLTALRAFGLDRVWWLVSPGNPLKRRSPAEMARRVAACRALIRHPRVAVTDLEARLGTRFTADTLAALRRRRPELRFVWLMGADNLASLHRWERWEAILRLVPVGVVPRPGAQLRAGLSPAATRFAQARLGPLAAQGLGRADPPAWAMAGGPMSPLSSTALRESGVWP
ncbi:MAG: nicotinate-nucleotide adenylyltransferase [Rubrimonas sp.]|uniref:nicotinate-nucleotide adenylyltransferase n=1 Tax=Rubrimonas sp. TaxID=2036015 RepID=UPI002FDCC51F